MAPPSLRGGAPGERLLFVAACAGSAFLLFLVQPMVGKRILPWFGGAPAVWTLCLAFYQSTLFLGYAYAHALIRFASPSVQLAIHALAVAAAIAMLPVLPGDAWRSTEVASPTLRVLLVLVASVSVPFFVLASTGPLLQAWFAGRHPAHSPYPLYAVSNLGSLAALVAYPFWIEPRFALSRSGDAWSLAFVVASGAVLACAFLARGRAPLPAPGPGGGVSGRRAALWLLLSGTAVVLLMGVTNKLCLDVASVPFLWILPLGAYLLSFVICFASESAYRRTPWMILAALALLPSIGLRVFAGWLDASDRAVWESQPIQIASFCVLLFAVCMLLHGELHRLRPRAGSLTAFYLCVSAGGALAGIFVGVATPRIFADYHELDLGLCLAALLLAVVWLRVPGAHAPGTRWRLLAGAVAALPVVLYAASLGVGRRETPVHQERSFFGVYRVLEDRRGPNVWRRLRNGSTLHGAQLTGARRNVPTTYYGLATGLGLVLADREASTGGRIGVVGLGVGTIASYAAPGDRIRFYEIDPTVVRLARDAGFFHYLEDTAAELRVVVGDARLALADEQARGVRQAFDPLVVDAFSSDAIPVHLLTVEAFAHYTAALGPRGLLAIHTSNRHFDLTGLVVRVGRETGLHALVIRNRHDPARLSRMSEWVWLSADPERLRALESRTREQAERLRLAPQALEMRLAEPEDVSHLPLWTDDYSDLLGVLRRPGRVGRLGP